MKHAIVVLALLSALNAYGADMTPSNDSPTGPYSDGNAVRYAIAGRTVTREALIAWRDQQDAETRSLFSDDKLAQLKVGDAPHQ